MLEEGVCVRTLMSLGYQVSNATNVHLIESGPQHLHGGSTVNSVIPELPPSIPSLSTDQTYTHSLHWYTYNYT